MKGIYSVLLWFKKKLQWLMKAEYSFLCMRVAMVVIVTVASVSIIDSLYVKESSLVEVRASASFGYSELEEYQVATERAIIDTVLQEDEEATKQDIPVQQVQQQQEEEGIAQAEVEAEAQAEAEAMAQAEEVAKAEAEAAAQQALLEQQAEQEAIAQSGQTIKLSSSELDVLERIVHAEAGNQDMKGKMLVANVVLNRVNNTQFPDTVKAVVFEHSGSTYQFSPAKSGSVNRVKVSEETKEAVARVLNGEDYSDGALYFVARSVANKNSLSWFDRNLTRLFTHGGHTFYK